MHEAYLAKCILEETRMALPSASLESVIEVVVRVGLLDAVEPESLAFMFEAQKSEYGLGLAHLRLTFEEVTCLCRHCEKAVLLKEPVFVCSHCGGTSLKQLTGRGITLMEITLQEESESSEDSSCPERA